MYAVRYGYMYVCMYAVMYGCMCVCMYVCGEVRLYVCMYAVRCAAAADSDRPNLRQARTPAPLNFTGSARSGPAPARSAGELQERLRLALGMGSSLVLASSRRDSDWSQ